MGKLVTSDYPNDIFYYLHGNNYLANRSNLNSQFRKKQFGLKTTGEIFLLVESCYI